MLHCREDMLGFRDEELLDGLAPNYNNGTMKPPGEPLCVVERIGKAQIWRQ